MASFSQSVAFVVLVAAVMAQGGFAAVASTEAGPIVTTADGKVQGSIVNGLVSQYLGIPFAAPPVGEQRWRAPGKVTPWAGVKQATSFAANCAQPTETDPFTHKPEYGVTSEDCLYLNVFTPASPVTSGPLPVMVWIYGGSWLHGGASLPLYNGYFSAVLDQDAIIVTLNYRLGVFGFLGASSLANRTSDGSYGLYGMLDQRAAMKWVQTNIAAFGGDPTRVTLYGESAGAGSISTHLVMEGSKGLFHQAMMESGPMAPWVGTSASVAEDHANQLMTLVGCTTIDCLLAVDTVTLQNNSALIKTTGVPQWGPVIDGVQLMGKPSALAAAGKVASRVPTLLGTNANEGRTFNPLPLDVTEEVVTYTVGALVGAENVDTVLQHYPLSDFASPWYQASRIIGDSGMTCAARRTARWLLQNDAPAVYLYIFTHDPYWLDSQAPYLGCAHTAELPFVWDFVPLLHGPEETTLADDMSTYWFNFGATGNPNKTPRAGGPKLVSWPMYNAEADIAMNLNTTLGTVAHLREARCDMWDSLGQF